LARQLGSAHRASAGAEGWKDSAMVILSWVRRDFVRWLLLVPVVSSSIVYVVSTRDGRGWGDSDTFKALMEVVHPVFIVGFLLVSVQSWRVTRDAAYGFLGVLGIFVLSRELLGQGSSVVLYVGLVFLTVYARRNGDKLTHLFTSRWAASFLLMCLVCYASSQLLDRGVVKRIGWLLLWDTSWKPPFASNFEEALEALGGLFLLLTPFAVVRKAPMGS